MQICLPLTPVIFLRNKEASPSNTDLYKEPLCLPVRCVACIFLRMLSFHVESLLLKLIADDCPDIEDDRVEDLRSANLKKN